MKTARLITARILPAIALLIWLALTPGCTTNNGDIGPIAGQWQLTAVDTDIPEYKVDTDDGKIYWWFQNTTIHMYQLSDDHFEDNRFGNYHLDDNTLFLDFPDEGSYGEPLMGLPRQCELQLLRLDGKQLELMYHPTDDSQVVYHFRKW